MLAIRRPGPLIVLPMLTDVFDEYSNTVLLVARLMVEALTGMLTQPEALRYLQVDHTLLL